MGEHHREGDQNLSDRDILIEVRSDMKHVREKMDDFQKSEDKQWTQLDEHGREIEGQKREINTLVWGFRVVIGGIIAGILGIFFAVKH